MIKLFKRFENSIVGDIVGLASILAIIVGFFVISSIYIAIGSIN